MSSLLDVPNDGDLCPLLFLIVLLSTIGSKMAQGKPELSAWGWRVAVGALVIQCGYGAYTFEPVDAADWVWVLFRGLLAAGLVLGLAWCVLSIASFVYGFGKKLSSLELPALTCARGQHDADEDNCRLAEEALAAREREEADRRAREEEAAELSAQAERRRADARASVELNYTRLATELQSIFTRDMLKAYMDAYMGDEHRPEDVERRGKDLIALLETHIERQDQRNNTSLDELDTWHQREKQRIDSSPADDRLKRRLLAALNVRYAELAAGLMEELEP